MLFVFWLNSLAHKDGKHATMCPKTLLQG